MARKNNSAWRAFCAKNGYLDDQEMRKASPLKNHAADIQGQQRGFILFGKYQWFATGEKQGCGSFLKEPQPFKLSIKVPTNLFESGRAKPTVMADTSWNYRPHWWI